MKAGEAHLGALRGLAAGIPSEVCWAFTGSLGHVLQGVPLDRVGDVDVVTDRAGCAAIEEAFADQLIEPGVRKPGERVSSIFAVFEIQGSRVEVMGDVCLLLEDGSWSEAVDVARLRRWVEVNDLRVPVMSLEWESFFYERLGRPEREALLRAHL